MNKVLARGIMTIAAVNDGKDGQTPHLHIAYANSPDGKVDFSTDDSKDRAYIGQYVSYTDEPDSTDAGMYIWSRFKGNDAVVYKLVMSSSQFNVKADGSFLPEFISIYAYKVQGENLTQLSPSKNVKVVVTKGENELPIKENSVVVRSDKWNLWPDKEDMNDVFNVDLLINDKLADRQKLVDKQKIHIVRDGRNGQDGKDGVDGRNGLDGKDGINGEKGTDGKDGKDAVIYKLLPQVENALAYFTEDTENTENTEKTENTENKKKKTKMVDVRLVYKIMKSVGEQVNFITNLIDEGMTLTIKPSVGEGVEFKGFSGIYGLSKSMKYDNMTTDSYVVTLTKGGEIVDRRIVPITFKPKVVFDIDTVNGSLTSQIEAVNGKMTKIEQNAEHISLTVDGGTRPNLLWGSDLDLAEVQDKIKLAYDNGDVIQQNTAKKGNLQRQLDATPTNDTAKRNDLQKKIDICNDAITAARNKVSECKAVIQKHLGVGIASAKIDSKEWFEYLKGGGVGGADAIKFKAMKDTSEFAGLFWEINAGAARNLQLKPNTLYTLSAWVRTEFDKDAQGYGVFAFEAFKKDKEDSAQRVGGLSFKTASSWFEPINEWTRVSTTFTTEELLYGSVAMWVNGSKPATLYICRPKLEEGNTATPWCAYDGTVEGLKRTGIDIENEEIRLDAKNTIVSDNLSVGSLKTVPKVKGDPFIEAHDGVFSIFTFERKKGVELSVDEYGMPHLIFYDKDGNPAYDLGWTGMKQLTDAVVQDYWSSDFLMKEDSYTDANRISKIMESDCRKFYTYHAAYNRKTGFYGSNEEYNDVTFVEKNFNKQRIADGFYYPMNNGSLARVANESAYIYGTRKFQYSNGKMIGFKDVYIEKDKVTGAWRFSEYKGGRGSNHSVDQHSQP